MRDYKPKYLPHYKPYNEPPVEWALGRKNAESKGFWYDRPSVFNEVMTVQKNEDGKIGPTLE